MTAGILKDETRRRRAKGEVPEIAGGGYHIAVEVVPVIVQSIKGEVILPTAGEEANFVVLPPLAEHR
jgi:hypothetical protein